MAPPTAPFNEANPELNVLIEAPGGLSRLTVPSGGSLTVLFKAATSYVRVATQGAELDIAWVSAGQSAGAKNSVGGAWPNPWVAVGQFDQLVLTDAAAAGVVPVDLMVQHGVAHSSFFPDDKSGFEGATEPHANS